jgi:diadenosine tetraphosphate (Ap4A) HIT family hydrolase
MTEPVSSTCDLCEEVRTGGTFATGALGFGHPLDKGSRLIRRTSVVDVYAGLGAIVPGYVLIVPRSHVLSCGSLDRADREQAFKVAWQTARELTSQLGQQVILAEHGSSYKDGSRSGACIDHAHIHLFPLPSGADPASYLPPGATEITGTDALFASSQGSYYYCSWSERYGFLKPEPALPSQHARQVWARSHGRPDQWDWALFPEYENILATVDLLRRDQIAA